MNNREFYYSEHLMEELNNYVEELKIWYNNRTINLITIKKDKKCKNRPESYEYNYRLLVNFNFFSTLMGKIVHLTTDNIEGYFDLHRIDEYDYVLMLDKYIMAALDEYSKFSMSFKTKEYLNNEPEQAEMRKMFIEVSLWISAVRYILKRTYATVNLGRNVPIKDTSLFHTDVNHIKTYIIKNQFKDNYHDIMNAILNIRTQFDRRKLYAQFYEIVPEDMEISIILGKLGRAITECEQAIFYMMQMFFTIDNGKLFLGDNPEDLAIGLSNDFLEAYNDIMKRMGLYESGLNPR